MDTAEHNRAFRAIANKLLFLSAASLGACFMAWAAIEAIRETGFGPSSPSWLLVAEVPFAITAVIGAAAGLAGFGMLARDLWAEWSAASLYATLTKPTRHPLTGAVMDEVASEDENLAIDLAEAITGKRPTRRAWKPLGTETRLSAGMRRLHKAWLSRRFRLALLGTSALFAAALLVFSAYRAIVERELSQIVPILLDSGLLVWYFRSIRNILTKHR